MSISPDNEVQHNRDIKQTLAACVEFDAHVKSPIVEILPETLLADMRQHLIDENKLSKKYMGKELSPAEYERVTSGYLFEVLNYTEYVARQFRGKKEGTQEWQDAQDLVTISDILCKIARYPREYGLNIDIRSRIPDGVYVGVNKEGDFNIFGLAEAKLGALDERALSQIRLSGSRTTMATLVEQVDALLTSTPKEELPQDLQELYEVLHGRHLKVKWNQNNGKKELSMSLDLLIPTRGESDGLFDQRVTYKSREVQAEFENIRDRQRVAPKNSPFSAAEVHAMAKKILQEIEL